MSTDLLEVQRCIEAVLADPDNGVCVSCGQYVSTDDGCDPTAVCHHCAQNAARLLAEALRTRDAEIAALNQQIAARNLADRDPGAASTRAQNTLALVGDVLRESHPELAAQLGVAWHQIAGGLNTRDAEASAPAGSCACPSIFRGPHGCTACGAPPAAEEKRDGR